MMGQDDGSEPINVALAESRNKVADSERQITKLTEQYDKTRSDQANTNTWFPRRAVAGSIAALGVMMALSASLQGTSMGTMPFNPKLIE